MNEIEQLRARVDALETLVAQIMASAPMRMAGVQVGAGVSKAESSDNVPDGKVVRHANVGMVGNLFGGRK